MAAVMVEIDTSDQRDVHAALLLWAKWARSVFAAIGWPSSSIISRMIEMGPMGASHASGQRQVEADETCERIDRAVGRLDETEQEVIIRTYLGPADSAQITARACGLTYQYYRQVLSKARRRIGDYMAGANEKK